MKWIVLFLCSAIVLTAYAQTNLVKNGDFREVEGNYLAEIKHVDSLHIGVKHWKSISQWGGQSVALKSLIQGKELEHSEWVIDKKSYQMDSAKANRILITMFVKNDSKADPFTREYLTGELRQPLRKGEKYKVQLTFFLPIIGCDNLKQIGFRLQPNQPRDYILDKRIDENAYHFGLPAEQGKWVDLDTTIVAKGGEQHIMLGYFRSGDDLKLYQVYEDDYYQTKRPNPKDFKKLKRKKICPNDSGVLLLISHVSVIDLEPESGRLSSGGVEEEQAVLEKKVAKEPIQKEWKYTLYFEENSTVPKEKELDSLLLELSQLDTTQTTYSISLTGYADQEGSTKNMLRLAQKRTKVVDKAIQKKQLEYLKDIGQNAKGNQGIISIEPIQNRRVEVVVRKE